MSPVIGDLTCCVTTWSDLWLVEMGTRKGCYVAWHSFVLRGLREEAVWHAFFPVAVWDWPSTWSPCPRTGLSQPGLQHRSEDRELYMDICLSLSWSSSILGHDLHGMSFSVNKDWPYHMEGGSKEELDCTGPWADGKDCTAKEDWLAVRWLHIVLPCQTPYQKRSLEIRKKLWNVTENFVHFHRNHVSRQGGFRDGVLWSHQPRPQWKSD